MNKHFYQRKTGIGALALSLFLMISFLLSPFIFPVSMSNRLAKAETAVEEEISSYLSGYGITDEEMDEQAERIASTYSQYVDFESNGIYLRLDPLLYEAQYGDAVENRDFDFDNANFSEEELLAIRDMRTIYTNINIMNALVDEELGYIDQYGEFIFTQFDSTMTARWRTWGCTLRWNRLTVNMDADWAKLIAAAGCVLNLVDGIDTLNDVIDELTNDDYMIEILAVGFNYLPEEISSRIISFFSDSKVQTLVDAISITVDLLETATVLGKVIKVLIEFLTPDIEDCIIVLYKACKFNYSMKLTCCWIPTWTTKWGISIKVFR